MKFRHFLPIALLCGVLTGAFYARAQMWSPWVKGTPAGGAGPLALSAHGVGTGGTGTAATTATVTLTGVAQGDRHVLFWIYCTNNCGTGGTPVAASSVTGTMGSTCAEVPAIQLAYANNGTGGIGLLGGAVCSATTAAGPASDTFTVTFASGVQYAQVWAVGYSGATVGEDTACRSKAQSGATQQTAWSAASGGNLSAAPEAAVSLLGASLVSTVPTALAGAILLDHSGTNTGQTTVHRIGGTSGQPVTLNGTWATADFWGQVMLCLH